MSEQNSAEQYRTEQWPMISIVTVSFNHAEFIRQNIESVLAQGYPNFEHIIVDGGSTDGTVDILRSYPHLKWTSEPDNGQSDALNKGFARVQGEFIGWLNSDDWYAPNIFFDVAKNLKEYPIVLGAGEETTKDGTPREVVPNIERTFWDVLKYWVPYAWLAQPPIFFRKSLLEETKRPDGKYLDEGLYFCMDYDLWARMAARCDFTRRIDRVLAHYRMYDANKTGKYPLATQRECGRVYRRYVYGLSNTEHRFSFIIPLESLTPQISDTLKSIAAQQLKDFEIIFVDYSTDRSFNKQLREFSLDIAGIFAHNSVRFVKSADPSLFSALNTGIQAACALFVITLQEGDLIGPDFLVETSDLFVPDCQGLALPLAWKPELKAQLINHTDKEIDVKIGAIFGMPYIYPNFVARKVTMLELDGLQHTEMPPLALRELVARTVHKSWGVNVNNSLSLKPAQKEYRDEQELLKVFDSYINSSICARLEKELAEDAFARVRLQHNTTFAIPELLSKKSHELLALAPWGWERLQFLESGSQLQQTCREYPSFAPAWHFVARAFEQQGDATAAAEARKKFAKCEARYNW